jgi:AcrR family transcriptional regulator
MLDAALTVFNRDGLADASMAALAAQAGVTRPTLYARLGDKAAIYARVIAAASESLVAEMTDTYGDVATGDFIDFIRTPVRRFLAWARTHPERFTLLFERERDAGEDALATVTEVAVDATRNFMSARQLEPVPLSSLALTLMSGVLHRAAAWALREDPDGALDTEAFVTAFIVGGLAESIAPERVTRLRGDA